MKWAPSVCLFSTQCMQGHKTFRFHTRKCLAMMAQLNLGNWLMNKWIGVIGTVSSKTRITPALVSFTTLKPRIWKQSVKVE